MKVNRDPLLNICIYNNPPGEMDWGSTPIYSCSFIFCVFLLFGHWDLSLKKYQYMYMCIYIYISIIYIYISLFCIIILYIYKIY